MPFFTDKLTAVLYHVIYSRGRGCFYNKLESIFMRKKIALVLMVGGLCSLNTFAKGNATDANGDGVFSRDEMIAAGVQRYEKKFSKADVNADGKVTLDEIAGKKLSVAKSADQNKDGVITRDEVKEHVTRSVDKRLAKKDTNKDGMLSKEERKQKKVL